MTLALIPRPLAVREIPGTFRLTAETAIAAPGLTGDALRVAEYLAASLRVPTGLPLPVGEDGNVLVALDPAVGGGQELVPGVSWLTWNVPWSVAPLALVPV